jgi:hypothetical protein
MEKTQKTSYKNVVVEQGEIEKTHVKEIIFTDYENLIFPRNVQTLTKKEKSIENCKRELLLDMVNDMSSITKYIIEYYGFHGIANDLKLEHVMDTFEKTLKVEVFSDSDFDMISEDDELQTL